MAVSRKAFPVLFLFLLLNSYGKSFSQEYLSSWESLDKHPIPQWFTAKFGVFIHWGPYSNKKECRDLQ
jgi:alpha-L-fucosidase